MKTKFIKKLSFVLVVAMVLSLFVPAAGAFAASTPKLNSTKKYLHLGRADSGENEFNFNIKNKKSGWKYFWESANEAVAEVNEKNGVTTATGVGKTKVTVTITDKDGEEVDTLSATVTVRDNIKEVTIANPVEKLGVNEEHDYNRNFKTESGSTKKTDSITRWTVEPAETATINDKGVFVATAAGEYTVTARSFQSKARYNAWLEDAEKYVDYVLDTDETKVVVSGSMKKVEQVDVKSAKVTFDSAMKEDEVKDNLKLNLFVGTVKSPQYVKSISLDEATGTEATIELYGPFNKGMTYTVDYPEMDSVSFEAATTDFSDVVRMTIDKGTAVAQEATEIEFTLYNAAGVDITDGSDSEYNGKLSDRVSFTTDSNGAYIFGKEITIFEIGTVAEVKATYSTYNYDNNGNEIGTLSVSRNIVGVKEAVVPANSLAAFTITTGANDDNKNPDFDDTKHRVAINADNPRIHVMVKDTDDEEIKSIVDGTFNDEFSFEAADDNFLFVSPDGYLYPVKEGAGIVIIKHGDVIVGYANVSILPEAKAASFTLSDYGFTLSNFEDAQDSKTVTMTVKDQYGDDIGIEDFDITVLQDKDELDESYVRATRVVDEDGDTNDIKFEVIDFDKTGRVTYQVEANGFKRTINVTLAKPTEGKTTYRLELDTSIDLAIKEEKDLDKKIDVKMFGYAPNGVKVTTNLATEDNITITKGSDKLTNGQSLYFPDEDAAYSVSGVAMTKIDKGTYKVVARYGEDNKVVATKYFTVTDTQKAAVFTSLKNGYYEEATLEAIAAECFEIKIDGNEIAAENILEVKTAIDEPALDKPFYVTEVLVAEYFGDDYIVHTVKIGKTVRPK